MIYMVNKKQIQKKFYKIGIGPLLLECLDAQKQSIKEESYGVISSSYYDAGEILAKKIIDSKLI